MKCYQPNLNLKDYINVTRELSFKKDKEFDYSGLWIFSGAQGSGKTLLAMHCIDEIMKEFPDCLLVTNVNIYGIPSIPYKGIEDFDKYDNGSKGIIFFIDEIHTLFNSLESSKMPLSTMQVWAQNRKNRRLIIGTSQRFNRVSKGIREQCTWNYECTRPILNFFSYTIKDGSLYDENGKYDTEDKVHRSFYIPKVSVMRKYNTLQVIERS